jgi:hypothetical protein
LKKLKYFCLQAQMNCFKRTILRIKIFMNSFLKYKIKSF